MAYYENNAASRQRAIERARMGLPPEDPLDPATAAAAAQGYEAAPEVADRVPANAPPTPAGGAPTYPGGQWSPQNGGAPYNFGRNPDGSPVVPNPGQFPNGPIATGAPTTGPGAPTRVPGTPAGTPASAQTPYGTTPRTDMGSGATPGHRRGLYAGFDFDQDANNRLVGKSAKYTTAGAAEDAFNEGADDSWKTKAGAQAWAEKWLKPKLEASGVEVLDIVGDKMFIRDYADRAAGRPGSWVDWVINADGANPQIGWQVETKPDNTDPKQRSTSFVATDAAAANAAAANSANTPATTQSTIDERARRLLARDEERMSRLGGQRSI